MPIEAPTAETEIPIAAGGLAAVFRAGDLFDVSWNGVEVVQRLYVAVRDEAWNTIPAVLTDVAVTADGDTATVAFTAEHRHGAIHFRWQGAIRLEASGRLDYRMHGRALTAFGYCKIGFNIHHGLAAHAGRRFRCRTATGIHEGEFAPDIQPQLVRAGTLTAMTPPFDALEVDLAGVRARFEFTGDRFEMQDHRNWADANWKTYGTPLDRGFPLRIENGGELEQAVRLTVSGAGAGSRRPAGCRAPNAPIEVVAEAGPAGRLPRIGHLLTAVPDEPQLERLRELRPDHVRIDLHPDGRMAERLATAERVAEGLAAGLEIGAFVRLDAVEADAAALAAAIAGSAVPVHRVLVLAEAAGSGALRGACPPEVVARLRAALGREGVGGLRILSGTAQSFADLNRDRPDYAGIAGVVCALNPQVHASDDRSLMQNVRAIPDIAACCHRLGAGEVVLSPVDLIGADGPFPGGPPAAGGPPANEDVRQREGFCAAWTLAALAAMTNAEVTSITLFELAGPRGLVEHPRAAFPVFDLLAALGPFRRRPVVPLRAADPERVAALAFEAGGGVEVFIANLTAGPLRVALPGQAEVELAAYGVSNQAAQAAGSSRRVR